MIAAPVLWGLGGGFGLVLGAVVASWITRRIWPGVFAAFVGAIPWTVLLVVAYNSGDLKAEDQIVGTLIVLVLPALIVACLFAVATALLARLVTGGRRTADARAPGGPARRGSCAGSRRGMMGRWAMLSARSSVCTT